MKKIFLTLFALLMIVSLVGCSPEAATPTTELTQDTTVEQTEKPTPEPTAIPTAKPTVIETPETVNAGKPKEVTYHDVLFTYNDKYGFKEDTESDILTITYIQADTFVQISYVEKFFDDEGEALLGHKVFLGAFFETQSVETNNVEVAGIDSICTLAYVKFSDNLPWMYFSLVTIPSSNGFVSFAFYSLGEDDLEGYVDTYWEMLETVTLIDG